MGLYRINDHETSIGTMIDCAWLALNSLEKYKAPAFAWYDEEILKGARLKQHLLEEIDGGLSRGQFHAHYQPIYDSRTKEIIAAEALVRWVHPERGMISPADFLPVIESTSFISVVDLHVLELACRFQRRRLDEGKRVVPISVNLSRNDLREPDFIETAIETVHSFDIDPSLISFEITESSFGESLTSTSGVLSGKGGIITLREHGFKILIDDYGTGYCNLSLLRNIPFDVLKIDKSLVQDLTAPFTGSIVKHLISAILEIDGEVVAEGVETEEQFNLLREFDCTNVQGFFFSRPLPEDEFMKLL